MSHRAWGWWRWRYARRALGESGKRRGLRGPRSEGVKARTLVHEMGPNAKVMSVAEAAGQSTIVVLAVPWENAKDAILAAGNLEGKTVVDVTNPVIMTPEGLQQGLVISHTTSAAEQIAQWAVGAHVVKAFNTTGWQNMADPAYGARGLTMLLCGDQAEPKQAVALLATQLGFEPVDVGPLRSARYLRGAGDVVDRPGGFPGLRNELWIPTGEAVKRLMRVSYIPHTVIVRPFTISRRVKSLSSHGLPRVRSKITRWPSPAPQRSR